MPKQVTVDGANAPANQTPKKPNLYLSVKTFSDEGRTVGERVVDLFHFNTRQWLASHLWWAMHHLHTVEVMPASPAEIEQYIEAGKQRLIAKFNGVEGAITA